MPAAPRHAGIPVLAYQGIDAREFTHQMQLLHRAGYRTVTLERFVRYLRDEPVRLPARPFLLTFDDGRVDAWSRSDAILRELGFSAVLFVDVGRVAAGDPAYLSWERLRALQGGGRWEVQLESGTGKQLIRWGPGRRDVGSFYAYRGADEVLGGWRERVFGDFGWAERQLAARVPGYAPLAVAPPYGTYGQLGTNDPRIPRLLLARLLSAFDVVFVQDRPGFAMRGAGVAEPVGRIDMTRRTGRELDPLLAP